MEGRSSERGAASGDHSELFLPSFEAVLRAAGDGDGRAFEQIFAALSGKVLVFARVRGASDPEGLVNDVFLQVFLGLGDFDGSEVQFRAWMFRIARNKLIDESRRKERRPVEVAADELTAALSDRDLVDSEAMDRIATDSLISRLAILTPEQRDVVMLRVVADLTIDDISAVIGKRPGAVKALQRRAFRTLAREFSAEAVPL
jgi:RNA polymerase sigma-70 factor (ECF subfamily)